MRALKYRHSDTREHALLVQRRPWPQHADLVSGEVDGPLGVSFAGPAVALEHGRAVAVKADKGVSTAVFTLPMDLVSDHALLAPGIDQIDSAVSTCTVEKHLEGVLEPHFCVVVVRQVVVDRGHPRVTIGYESPVPGTFGGTLARRSAMALVLASLSGGGVVPARAVGYIFEREEP